MIALYLLSLLTTLICVVSATILGFGCAVYDLSTERSKIREAITMIRIMTIVTLGTFVLSMILFGLLLP